MQIWCDTPVAEAWLDIRLQPIAGHHLWKKEVL